MNGQDSVLMLVLAEVLGLFLPSKSSTSLPGS